ncbi:hypothetical protein G6F57_022986 [Rhizopus arrhizus]|nr:hypothetical protein G6F57_022986 [Rhizopus arrhizus]
MGDGELGAGVDHAVGGRHGLLGFAAVVDQDRFELLALHAALGVDGLDGGQGAGLDLVAILGVGTGHGLGNADLDRVGGVRGASQGKCPKRHGYRGFERL